MPIEIKELIIRAIVVGNNNKQQDSVLTAMDILKLKKEITKEVTEKVLKTLQQKNER
jgi:hypothetical protein